jgi:hypothetical protein
MPLPEEKGNGDYHAEWVSRCGHSWRGQIRGELMGKLAGMCFAFVVLYGLDATMYNGFHCHAVVQFCTVIVHQGLRF